MGGVIMPDEHIQKIADLKKEMIKKIPELTQEIQKLLSRQSAGLLDQRYLQVCRNVQSNLDKLNSILPRLDPKKEKHYIIIAQIALYLINNASINLVFSHDNRQSILKNTHWATVADFGKFIFPVIYRPELIDNLLNPKSAKSLDFQ